MALTLPPVAKSFFTFCKKCETDRYHKVLTHKSATSAQVQCETCGKKGTYTLPKSQDRKSGTRAPSAAKQSAAKLNHQNEYQALTEAFSAAPAVSYSMKTKFLANQKVDHPKFGTGFVLAVFTDKVDVAFSDEVKSLVHNRG